MRQHLQAAVGGVEGVQLAVVARHARAVQQRRGGHPLQAGVDGGDFFAVRGAVDVGRARCLAAGVGGGDAHQRHRAVGRQRSAGEAVTVEDVAEGYVACGRAVADIYRAGHRRDDGDARAGVLGGDEGHAYLVAAWTQAYRLFGLLAVDGDFERLGARDGDGDVAIAFRLDGEGDDACAQAVGGDCQPVEAGGDALAGDGEGVVEQTLGGEGAAGGVLRRGGVRRRYGVGSVDERRNYRNCISGCRSRHTGRN